MNHVDEIFARLNLQQIQSFLLSGEELGEISSKDYKSRIDEAWKPLTALLKQKFPETEEYEKIMSKVYACASTTENVHMEVGIQCGATLAVQLFIQLIMIR